MKLFLKKKLARLTVFVLAACMLFSVTAFADDITQAGSDLQAQNTQEELQGRSSSQEMLLSDVNSATTKISISDCTEIGTSETYDCPVYYYNIGNSTTNLEFTDFEGKMSDTDSIMGLYSYYAMVSGTNIADVNEGFGIKYSQLEADTNIKLNSAAEGLDYSNIYGVVVMYSDLVNYEVYSYVFIIQGAAQADPIPTPSTIGFSTADGYISAYEEDGLTYYGSEYAPEDPNADQYGFIYPEKKMDVYTVSLYGTPDVVNINFTAEALAYGYDSSGTYICSCGAEGDGNYANNGQTGQTAAKVPANADGVLPDYVYVQTPYTSSWTSENLYAIQFEYTYTFDVSYEGIPLTNITYTPDNYSYYDYMTQQTVRVGTYTVKIPEGCEKVKLTTSDNTLAYNYSKDGEYIYGYYSDYTVGATEFDVAVDYDRNGENDYIQVQTPYDSSWNSTLLYTITFESEGTRPAPDDDQKVLGFDEAYDAMTKVIDSKLKDSIDKAYASSNDWYFLGLARAGKMPLDEYVGVLKNNISPTPRMVLALTSAGYDPQNFCGQNLLEKFSDLDEVTGTGYITDVIFTLIALDSHTYEIPDAQEGKTQTTRAALINKIIEQQTQEGCWGYTFGGQFYTDIDATAEAVTAMAPYYNLNSAVKVSVDSALLWLADQQSEDASFGENSCSTSQVIVALTALGINPATDERFIVNGKNMIDALCTFVVDDGFKYMSSSKAADAISTYEGYYAMVAYKRLLSGSTSLYDMNDVSLHENGHTWDEGKVTKKPSCSEEGVLTYTCTECDATVTESIDKTPHEYKDGVCINCGAKDPDYVDEKTSGTEKESSNSETKASEKSTDKTPQTGDSANTALWIVLAGFALASMGAAGFRYKRNCK